MRPCGSLLPSTGRQCSRVAVAKPWLSTVSGRWHVPRSASSWLWQECSALRWPDRRTRHWAQRLEADLEAWAILHRHPVGPEVAGDSVQGSLDDGGDDGGPQRYQFVSRGRSGSYQTASQRSDLRRWVIEKVPDGS